MSSGEIAGAWDSRAWESVPGVPAPSLRPLVAWYSGYRQAGVPPATHRGLPSPYLTLIITLDDPLDLAVPTDPSRPPGRYHTLLGGLHTSPAILRHDGRQSGIQLGLKPLGARVLLGLPAGELHCVDTDAADVLGPVAADGPWARDLVYSRSLTIAGGTSQVNKNIIAQRILGLPRSS